MWYNLGMEEQEKYRLLLEKSGTKKWWGFFLHSTRAKIKDIQLSIIL